MASLMTPTVGPSSGVTNRINSFAQNTNYVEQAQRDVAAGNAQLNALAQAVITMRLQAHNAANEARVTDYTLRLQQEHNSLLNELKTKTNQDAIDAREGIIKAFDDVQTKMATELQDQDPYVRQAFAQRARELAFRSTNEVDAYVVEQSVKYRDTQRKAQVDNLYEQMAMNFDNPVLFAKAREEFETARAQQDDELGIEVGSPMSIARTMEYTNELYTNEAIRLMGQKRFGDAQSILKGAAQNGLIKADSYNRQFAKLLAQQEAEARQAEADAQRRAAFAMAQARHVEQMKTEELKQQKYKREALDEYYKNMYSALPEYQRNAMLDSRVNSLLENGVFKYSERTVINPDTGLEEVVTVENTANEQRALAQFQAMEDQKAFEISRLVTNSSEQNAFNVLNLAATKGQGDSVLERATNFLQTLPDGTDREILAKSLNLIRSGDYTEQEIENRVKLKFDYSVPTSTAMARNLVSNMNARDIPLDEEGRVDDIALRTMINRKGVDNYDVMTIRADAQKLADSAKSAQSEMYLSKPWKDSRMSILSVKAYNLLDNDALSEDVFSFDLDDGKSSDAEDRQKYEAGQYILQRVMDDLERQADAGNFSSMGERQRYIMTIMNNASTTELFLKHARDYMYDVGAMSVEEINAYDNERIEKWKKAN